MKVASSTSCLRSVLSARFALGLALLAIVAWEAHPWAHALGDPHGDAHASCFLVKTLPQVGGDHAESFAGEDLHGCLLCAFSGQVDLAPPALRTHAAATMRLTNWPSADNRLELKPIARTQPQRGPPAFV